MAGRLTPKSSVANVRGGERRKKCAYRRHNFRYAAVTKGVTEEVGAIAGTNAVTRPEPTARRDKCRLAATSHRGSLRPALPQMCRCRFPRRAPHRAALPPPPALNVALPAARRPTAQPG